MAKYKAIITTLDRGIYLDADVVACDALQAAVVPVKCPRQRLTKDISLIGGKA